MPSSEVYDISLELTLNQNVTAIDSFNHIVFHFSNVLESFGYNVPENELTSFISQLDIDKSGEYWLFVFVAIIVICFTLRNY